MITRPSKVDLFSGSSNAHVGQTLQALDKFILMATQVLNHLIIIFWKLIENAKWRQPIIWQFFPKIFMKMIQTEPTQGARVL